MAHPATTGPAQDTQVRNHPPVGDLGDASSGPFAPGNFGDIGRQAPEFQFFQRIAAALLRGEITREQAESAVRQLSEERGLSFAKEMQILNMRVEAGDPTLGADNPSEFEGPEFTTGPGSLGPEFGGSQPGPIPLPAGPLPSQGGFGGAPSTGGFDPTISPQDALREALTRSEAFDIFQSNRFPGAGQGLQRRAFGRRFGDFENAFTTQSAINSANQDEALRDRTFSQFLEDRPDISGAGQRAGIRGALGTGGGGTGISPRETFLSGLGEDPTSQFNLAFGALGANRSNPFFGSIRDVARRRFNQQLSSSNDPTSFIQNFANRGFRF